jgi:hypothetical protein
MKTKYDLKMDALTLRVARVIDGVDAIDAACVCACVAAHSIKALPANTATHRKTLAALYEFMEDIIEGKWGEERKDKWN